jgi:hypothetical protein
LWASTKEVIAAWSEATLRWTPRLIWRSLRRAKKRSTWLIQDAPVGV